MGIIIIAITVIVGGAMVIAIAAGGKQLAKAAAV
jgi:hypothetical protein